MNNVSTIYLFAESFFVLYRFGSDEWLIDGNFDGPVLNGSQELFIQDMV